MADSLLPAEPGTLALEVQYDDGGFVVIEHPVVGWAHVSGEMVHPLTVANCTNVRAVAFPDGRVTDRRTRVSYPSRAKWADRVGEDDPPEVQAEAAPNEPLEPETPETLDDIAAKYQDDVTNTGRLIDDVPGLSTRAKNALKGLGAAYVRDLAEYQRADIKGLKSVPPSAMPALEDALKAEGLRWYVPSRATTTLEGDNDDLL